MTERQASYSTDQAKDLRDRAAAAKEDLSHVEEQFGRCLDALSHSDSDLDARCPYDDPQLRKAFRRGLKAAQAGKSIDACSHRYFGGEPLLAFVKSYAQPYLDAV